MHRIACRDWKDFHKQFLFAYAAQDLDRRNQLLFRGQADSRWRLRTTLDRYREFSDDLVRARHYDEILLPAFRREAICMFPSPSALPQGLGFELLARHHRLPSPFLDWTESPYIASFFAFDDVTKGTGPKVAIWVLDCARFIFEGAGIELINDREELRFNPRALRQRGQFTRIRTIRQPLEAILGGALTKITIDASGKGDALASLDEMGINAAGLYSDLDGVAKTVTYRHRSYA
jgi:hypothetical protein